MTNVELIRTRQPQTRPLKEAVRWLLTVLWFVALSLFTFSQYRAMLFLERHDDLLPALGFYKDALPLYWIISWAPALAFGMAWFSFTCLRDGTERLRWSGMHHRRLRVQVFGSLSTAMFLVLFCYRIVPVIDMVGLHGRLSSEPIRYLYYGELQKEDFQLLLAFSTIALLGAALVFMQATSAVYWLTGRRKAAISGFLAMAILAVAAPLVVQFPERRLARSWPEDARALVRGGAGSLAETRELRRTYFETFDAEGRFLPYRQISELRNYEETPEVCDACLMPYTVFLTWRGIPLDIGPAPPTSTVPEQVLEIPLSANTVRIYGRAATQPWQVARIDGLQKSSLHDWLVLKIDGSLEMGTVRELLSKLQSLGVRRVSLAAVPADVQRLGEHPVRLELGSAAGVQEFRPEERVRKRRPVVTVRRYVPPPPRGEEGEPRELCYGDTWWELTEEALRWKIPASRTCPRSVQFAMGSQVSYQQFISWLDRAILCGAELIHLPPLRETE